MRSPVHNAIKESLALILRPIVSLCLKCGMGYSEFNDVTRSVFVSVATSSYGIRGRPTNVSRVAAITGISRKEIRKYRDGDVAEKWSPELEATPAAAVLHYWHFDPAFSSSPGNPRPLKIDEGVSFSDLVRKYSGDIPPGALKAELERAGAIKELSTGEVVAAKRYLHPAAFDEDFVRKAAFSLKNLANTIDYNSELIVRGDFTPQLNEKLGRLERFTWADRLDDDSAKAFRKWVRKEGADFIERADDWIGNREFPEQDRETQRTGTIGVGIYYFEESDEV